MADDLAAQYFCAFWSVQWRFDLFTHLRLVLWIVPEIATAPRDLDVSRRLLYTFGAVSAFLCLSHLPIYGNRCLARQDPLYHLRLITASSKYTLMEFGVGPLTMSSVALSVLGSLGLIVRDTSTPESNAAFSATHRLMCFVFTPCSASYAIATGHFGTFE
jgi:protein transport protein SEC61 subunit alpha